MSALANTVAVILASVPVSTGDQPYASSLQQDVPTYASGAVSSNERGRLVPPRIIGYPAWRCTRGKGVRNVRCTMTRVGPVSVIATYQAAGGRSMTWAAAKRVGR